MSGYRQRRDWAWNGEIGPVLEAAREQQGISLKEAERNTSIRWRYLEGLEREDPKELPHRTYVQGFIGSYAEFLGLDVDELSRKFTSHTFDRRRLKRRDDGLGERGRHSSGSESDAESVQTSSVGRRRLGKGTLITLSLLLVAVGFSVAALYIVRGDSALTGSPLGGGEPPVGSSQGDGESVSPPQPSQAGDTTPTPVLERGGDEAPQGDRGSLRARVMVTGAESWISVEADSEVAYTGIAQPGFSQSFEAGETFSITTGNAGAVELRLNDIKYGRLGQDGEVTARSFDFKRERQGSRQ